MSVLAPVVAGRTTWAKVSDGLFVASRTGEYVGYVESTAAGHFVGFDFRSTPVGRYSTLAEAQRAVTGVHASPASPRVQSLWQTAAVCSGVIALGALTAAVLTTPVV